MSMFIRFITSIDILVKGGPSQGFYILVTPVVPVLDVPVGGEGGGFVGTPQVDRGLEVGVG